MVQVSCMVDQTATQKRKVSHVDALHIEAGSGQLVDKFGSSDGSFGGRLIA